VQLLRALRRRAKPAGALALFAAASLLVVTPATWGLPTGMFPDASLYPGDATFFHYGCTACHSDGKALGKFWPDTGGNVTIAITDAQGKPLPGMVYAKATVYNITITLHNEQAADKENHAGFNIRTTAGKFSVPAGNKDVQVDSKAGTQATHTNPGHTKWTVLWTAPDAGAAHFTILVNDVNGEKGADAGDHVYQTFMDLTDTDGAQLGAAAASKEVEFGISLQQYWIGLIGLLGMIVIMVAGFVYLKFVNPHNTDPKDR
jgi:hypothetical protein